MESFLVIMQIVALGCLSVLSIYMIIILTRVRDILSQIQTDLKEITSRAIPVFANLEEITDKIKRVTSNLDEQMVIVKNTISSFKSIGDNVALFEQQIQQQIQEPIFEAIGIFTSMIKGIRSFVDRVRS